VTASNSTKAAVVLEYTAPIQHIITRAPLVSFVIIAFGISWAIWAPLVLGSSLTRETLWWLYYAGVLGPAAAAVICARFSSESESLLRRVRRWRVSAVWYAVAMLLPFAIRGAAVAAVFLYAGDGSEVVLRPPILIMSTTALMLLLVPFEEIGWRGYALPILQREHTPLLSSMIVGTVWALWHLPLAWASVGYQRTGNPWSYMGWFFITILPVSCLATWVFNRTGESVLLASLLHIAVNIADFVLVLPATTGQAVLFTTFMIATAVVGMIYWTDRLGVRRRSSV
jgi:uncharacterized protein